MPYTIRNQINNATGDGLHDLNVSSVIERNSQVVEHVLNETKAYRQVLSSAIHAPKIQLTSFSGCPTRYWPFLRGYQNVVEKNVQEERRNEKKKK